MSDEMAVGDNATSDENKVNRDETAAEDVEGAGEATPQPVDEPPIVTEEAKASVEDKPETESLDDNDKLNTEVKEEIEETTPEVDEQDGENRGTKRRASIAFSEAGDEEFKGFEESKDADLSKEYSRVLERLEAEVQTAIKDLKPIKSLKATISPIKASKRPRQDTDGSRPSSALSTRSDGEWSEDKKILASNKSVEKQVASALLRNGFKINAGASPGMRGRRSTTEMSSPLLRVPLERGWRRELVYRAALDAHSRRNADIYYYTPQGKKLRSSREVAENLAGTGLTLENFSFFKEPLGVDDPEKEIIRDAKLMRRVESPVPATQPALEGKRTPKPKPPKGASPEPTTPKSPPAKLKVKSLGSRLSNNGTPPVASAPKQSRRLQAAVAATATAATATPTAATIATATATAATLPAAPDNNNTAAWKKPSEKAGRGRVANGAASPLASPRRRGRPRAEDVDHFTAFCTRAQQANYNVAVQIFQYLGMRDLAHSARVCKLWQQLASTPALWRHVRMKNSHVSDWCGLCAALKSHGTKWLDLRKMLLPQNDTIFWDQFAEHIGTVDTLERLELCRCPARAVEAAMARVPSLRALAAPAIRDARLDPAPLAALPRLELLRLKSLAGLALASDLRPLAALTRLQHLSLTSIKELGWCACEVVGQLEQLESLELGECSFGAAFATALARLSRLRRLRLERGVAHCAAPALLRALATLPRLTRLELVNFDVKVGFDDALAECKNIQRLLIIPTYVSQSATTNKQVLSGVLRLKETLTHLMWGVTIELLRVTELFIDQCEQGGDKRRDVGECIPVLKPVPGCRLPDDADHVAGPPQVEILPLPTLQRLLSAQMPNTKLKLLRIPFHATWRQSLADFQ
ncbi:PREDICTED: uncharacterized protein LOC106128291 isoform X2 [Papilio xuthus]|uniref:Uncharacterized protein LOC106128291 isoform X2 n=1 Tax=Papilio xuthus TaxID=66420 RepID=A0AAJ6ZYL9_PAPXU|nr:PREDICTED: uncharacterized protein LOC106128291 isoform X2 [Papilio xuthus]